jgi:hypothetical protein
MQKLNHVSHVNAMVRNTKKPINKAENNIFIRLKIKRATYKIASRPMIIIYFT